MQKSNQQSGFTLIELLVSIAIIGIMATVVTVNLNHSNERSRVKYAAKKLVSDIHKTQAYSLGLKKYNTTNPSGGWGVYLSEAANDEYRIFYIESDTDSGYLAHGAGEEVFKLENGVFISDVTVSPIPNGTSASVVFVPPDLKVAICRNGLNVAPQCNRTNVSVTLSNSSGDTEEIIINKFGLAEVQ